MAAKCLFEHMADKRKLKRGIIIKWALSYFVVCIVPLVVFVFFAFTSSAKLLENVSYSNSLFLDSLSKLVDNAFSQNNMLAESLLLSSEMSDFNPYGEGAVSSTEWYNVTTAIRRNLGVNNAVSDAALYSPTLSRYVSGSRWGSFQEFWQRKELDVNISSEDVVNLFSRKPDKVEVYDASLTTYDGSRIPRILVLRPLSYVKSYSQGDWSLASIIDIYSILPSEMRNYTSFLIVDEKGTVRFDSSGDHKSGEVISALANISGRKIRSIDSYIVSSSPSVVSGLSYVVLTEKSEYYRITNSLIIMAVFLFFLSIVFSILFIFFRVKVEWLNYEKALDVLGDDVEWSLDKKNEYAPFTDSNRKLRESKEIMGSVIESQTKSLKEYAIRRLLDTQSSAPVSQEALKECGISFLSDRFAVLIVSVDDEMKEKGEEIVSESLGDDMIHITPFPSTHGLAYIISFVEEICVSGEAESILESRIRDLLDNYPWIKRAASSDTSIGLESVGRDYLEAINVLEYEIELSSRDYLSSGDVVGLIDRVGYEYTQEDEYNIQKSVEDGNELSARDAINSVVDRNKKNGVSPRNMRYLLFSIMGTVIRTSNRLSKQYLWDLPPFAINSIIQTKDINASLSEVIEATVSIVRKVVSIRSESADSTDEAFILYKKALKIVQEEYSSSLLNVSSLAQKLDVSNVQLSKVFKRYHGANISDYIAQYRVAMAKNLLSQDKEIKEIVYECGFGSLRTFLRLFKKYENITPSQYKAMRKENTNGET